MWQVPSQSRVTTDLWLTKFGHLILAKIGGLAGSSTERSWAPLMTANVATKYLSFNTPFQPVEKMPEERGGAEIGFGLALVTQHPGEVFRKPQ